MYPFRLTLALTLVLLAMPALAQDRPPVLKPDGAIGFSVEPSLDGQAYVLTNRNIQDLADAMDYALGLQVIAERAGRMGMAYGVARNGELITGVVSDNLLLVPGGPGLIRQGSGPVENFDDPLVGIWGNGNVGFVDPLLGFVDPLLGFVDPLLGFDDPLVGIWGNGNVGFEEPALGYEDPLLGLNAVWETASELTTAEYAFVLISYPLQRNRGRFTGSAVVVPFDLVDGAAGAAAPPPSSGQRAASAPVERSLSVYPNPSRTSATLTFKLAETEPARLAVYDVLGRRVALLADGPVEAGRHAVTFDASALPAGLYVVQLRTAAGIVTERLTVAR